MSLIVVFDEGASPEAVLEIHASANTPDYDGRTDVLVNPSYPQGVPRRYLKHEGGNVVEMTQAEKDAVDAAALAASDEAERLGARSDVDSRLLRAVVAHFHARINAEAPVGRQLTAQEAKDDILLRIDAG